MLSLIVDHWAARRGSGSDGSGASTRPAFGLGGGGPRCSMCPKTKRKAQIPSSCDLETPACTQVAQQGFAGERVGATSTTSAVDIAVSVSQSDALLLRCNENASLRFCCFMCPSPSQPGAGNLHYFADIYIILW